MGNHIENIEKKAKQSITVEVRIMKSLGEEYEHQFGLKCTYRERSEDKKRA